MSTLSMRLRTLREDASLTQKELAKRTGIGQPKLSDYERGITVPSSSTIERIEREVRPRPSEMLERCADQILATAQRYNLTDVRVFGSAVRGTDGRASDVDLLVTPTDDASLFDVSGFAVAAEQLLGYPVDVVSDRAPASMIMDRIRAEAVPL
ncbi:Cro/Cl family transcriptional regulator [Subtercola sp. Z020]|uniref:helix-turn-helix domain-containing protein n=1 Tax=Subtercola sp. Z020 TaxID=2080582 RepID=UPI000CE7DA98|nr:Cro/Cl family transcriptional regulator [Subtercola sp. Z020]